MHCCAVLGLSKHRIIECKNLAFNPESGCQIIISGDYCPVIFVVTSLHLVVGSWIIMSVILKVDHQGSPTDPPGPKRLRIISDFGPPVSDFRFFYSSCLPNRDLLNVAVSANSKSPPTGNPWAILVTLDTSGLSS